MYEDIDNYKAAIRYCDEWVLVNDSKRILEAEAKDPSSVLFVSTREELIVQLEVNNSAPDGFSYLQVGSSRHGQDGTVHCYDNLVAKAGTAFEEALAQAQDSGRGVLIHKDKVEPYINMENPRHQIWAINDHVVRYERGLGPYEYYLLTYEPKKAKSLVKARGSAEARKCKRGQVPMDPLREMIAILEKRITRITRAGMSTHQDTTSRKGACKRLQSLVGLWRIIYRNNNYRQLPEWEKWITTMQPYGSTDGKIKEREIVHFLGWIRSESKLLQADQKELECKATG